MEHTNNNVVTGTQSGARSKSMTTNSSELTIHIEKSLQMNRKIQSEIILKLQQIAHLKQLNRNRYIKVSTSLDKYYKRSTKCKCVAVDSSLSSSETKDNHDDNDDDDDDNGARNSSRRKKKIVVKRCEIKSAKGWGYDENRKWTRRFFLDPNGSTPEENEDTIIRRKWEGDLIGEGSYRYNPWTKQELDLLKKCVEEVRHQQQEEIQVASDNESVKRVQVKDVGIDFHKVFDLIKEKLSQTKLSSQQIKKIQSNSYSSSDKSGSDGTIQLRRWSDYRNKYLFAVSPSINNTPFTRDESLKILELFHQNNGNPLWDEVALSLNTSRTPFQCFKHARTSLNSKVTTFNAYEDELLLKIIAASGPQYVLDQHTATLLSQRFFPHLSKRQILHRSNVSLLNPNYRNERWSEDEERMLVLGMRAFSDDDCAVTKVAALIPNRAAKSVIDKWNRSLKPMYSTQPFTIAEDKKLLSYVKKHKIGPGNWKVVSKIFPTRNPRSLLFRWMELAKDDDILKRQGEDLIQKSVGKRGLVRVARYDETDDRDILNADDFVIRFKKKIKKDVEIEAVYNLSI